MCHVAGGYIVKERKANEKIIESYVEELEIVNCYGLITRRHS